MRAIGMGKLNALAIAVALAMGTICISQGVQAQAQTAEVRSYDIPAGKLSESLKQFGMQSRLQLLAPPELTKGLDGNPVSGTYTASQALDRLLVNSGLSYEFVNATTVVIKKVPGPAPVKTKLSSGSAGTAMEETHSAPTVLDAVTVTGTRIRGGTTPSPVITIGSEQIQQEGFTDLGEVIRSIPQNFSGGQNPGITGVGPNSVNIANANVTGGSALDLRGLGPDATLTLLNGRRLSYDGFVQAVDISAIPVEAVERLEVVPDGASAIYGSDAVGGVANVVLRRDFKGLTLGTRYGSSADGGLITRAYAATAGATWNSGGLIATFMKEDQAPIYADQRDYTQEISDPTTIYFGHTLRSGLFSVHQNVGDNVELRLDALKTDRDITQYAGYPGYYYYEPMQTTISLVAPSVLLTLPGDWTLTTSFTSGKDRNIYPSYLVMANSRTAVSDSGINNKSRTWEVGAEGPLFHIGENEVRLATGFGSRTNDFAQPNLLTGVSYGGDERNNYAYGELAVPLVSQETARPGLQRLELSLAVRSEDYDSFGRVTTPKIGIIYDPSEDFTFKTSWGHSFKAATLFQRYGTRFTYLWAAPAVGGVGFPAGSTVLMFYGGNPVLNPERAHTWTASLDFHPKALPALDAELNYFNIDYTDRVAQPITPFFSALNNPAFAPYVAYSPTEQQQQALIAEYGDAFYNLAGALYDPSKVVAIVYDQYTNVRRQRAKGLDLTGSYKFDLGAGVLRLHGSASWLDSSQQNIAGEAPIDLSGTIFYPAKLKSRIGAVWSLGGFSMSGFVNYTSGVTSQLTAVAEKTDSFTTFDTTLNYEVGSRNDVLSRILISLSVQNLFNQNPPLYMPPTPRYPPYDSTNYSAIGRYVSISVAKHW